MTNSNRRTFLQAALAVPAARAVAQTAGVAAQQPRPVLENFREGGVRLLDGMLKRQQDATRDYYFNISDDSALKGFRQRAGLPAPGEQLGGWYGGDVPPPRPEDWPRQVFSRGDMFNAFGQWLSGMARMYRARGDRAMLDKAVRLMTEWAKTIEPDGYFYYSRYPIGLHYTYDKTVCGLVDLYEFGGVKEALPPLEKITGWAVRNLDRARVNPRRGASAGVAGCEWYTLPENLYRAYLLTGNAQYKTFGELWRYPRYWEAFLEEADPVPPGWHAYSHCNTLSSAAMTYAITGERRYLSMIVNAFNWLERTQCYATGGYGPDEQLLAADGSLGRSLETVADTCETTCGSWAGFKLGRYLISFTGEARYGDWIEKLVYNGIGAALPMGPGGRTFYNADYRLGGGRKRYHPDLFPCCSGTYLQAVADYPDLIYFRDRGGLYVNLYVPSAVRVNLDGTEVHVEQETAYPESEVTRLTVRPSRSQEFDLHFRVPRWSQGITASVNGKPVEMAAQPGTWATLRRTWNDGDRVEVRIPLPVYLAPIDKQHPRRAAVMRGPVVMVRRPERIELPAEPGSALSASPDGSLQATLRSSASFVPFYRLAEDEPYTMYFDLGNG